MGKDLAEITRDDGQIGGGEVERGQVGGVHPAECRVFVRLRRSAGGLQMADERDHLDNVIAVVVFEAGKVPVDNDFTTELFFDFALDRVLGEFAWLDFAAREFPFQCQVFVRRSLSDQNQAALALDYSADNGNGWRTHGPLQSDESRRHNARLADREFFKAHRMGVRNGSQSATFRRRPGFRNMKAFLKILLLVVACIVAVKLLPVTLALGVGLAAVVGVVVVLGFSALAVLVCGALALAAVLAPIWLPVLLLVGIIALVKRCGRAAA